jgi:hypothetical protein
VYGIWEAYYHISSKLNRHVLQEFFFLEIKDRNTKIALFFPTLPGTHVCILQTLLEKEIQKRIHCTTSLCTRPGRTRTQSTDCRINQQNAKKDMVLKILKEAHWK